MSEVIVNYLIFELRSCFLNYQRKIFVTSLVNTHPMPNVVKLFTDVFYECSPEYDRVFITYKPFQSSLIFAGTACMSKGPFMCSTQR